jgi:L-ascorbate metabolism protein UlaG (beta-lactamase superfamily)
MKMTYLGHSAFELEVNNSKILIDPFLVCSPNYNLNGVTDILVTHGHGDHLGSAIDISKKTGATITAIFELANYCAKHGVHANGIGLGAWINFDWGKIIAVPAFHSSSDLEWGYAGCPCGYIISTDELTIYHAGDTNLNSEMKLIAELYHPDIALLPVGGTYTMDIEHASIAAEWIKAKVVIPMHYNTFDAIKVNIKDFEQAILKQGKKPLIMNIGQTYNP